MGHIAFPLLYRFYYTFLVINAFVQQSARHGLGSMSSDSGEKKKRFSRFNFSTMDIFSGGFSNIARDMAY